MDARERGMKRPRVGGPRDFSPAVREARQAHRLFVANLPLGANWKTVKDFFLKHVGAVTFVDVFKKENGEPTGCAVLEFADLDRMLRAVHSKDKLAYEGHILSLRDDSGVQRNKFGDIIGIENEPHSNSGINSSLPVDVPSQDIFNTFGLSIQFLDSLEITPPLTNKVFIQNLEYNVSRRKLRELLTLAGRVFEIDINVDKEGKSKGHASAEYSHPLEAVQAISMLHNQFFFGRRISVKMDHFIEKKRMKLPDGLEAVGPGLGDNGSPLRDVALRKTYEEKINQQVGVAPESLIEPLISALSEAMPTLYAAVNSAGLNTQPLDMLNNQLNPQGMGDMPDNNYSGSGVRNQMQMGMGMGNAVSNQMGMNNMVPNQMGMRNNNMMPNQMGMNNMMSNQMGNMMPNQMGNMMPDQMGMGNMMPNQMGNSMRGQMGNKMSSEMNQKSNQMRNDKGKIKSFKRPHHESNFGNNLSPNSANPEEKSHDMVVINNLPPTVSWRVIREKFGECGDIRFAEMTGKDSAVVRYRQDWEAQRAIHTYDMTRVEGCMLSVQLY